MLRLFSAQINRSRKTNVPFESNSSKGIVMGVILYPPMCLAGASFRQLPLLFMHLSLWRRCFTILSVSLNCRSG